MYEDTFGTDWTDLDDREEAVRRAFALGVAARLGERHPGELDRISRAVGSTYDRSFVELAYHEGRDKAKDVVPEADSDEEVWAELVEGETRIDPDKRPDADEAEEDSEVPDAIKKFDVDSRPDDSRDVVSQPKFLTREGAEEPEGRNRARRSRSSDDDGDDDGPDLSEEEREEFEELLEPDDGDED